MQNPKYSREVAADCTCGMIHAALLVGLSMAAGLLVVTMLA